MGDTDLDALASILYQTMSEIALEQGLEAGSIPAWSEATEAHRAICRRLVEKMIEPLEAKMDALQERLAAQHALVLELEGRLAEGHRNHIDSWPL